MSPRGSRCPETGHPNVVPRSDSRPRPVGRSHTGRMPLSPRQAQALRDLVASLDVQPEHLPLADGVGRWQRMHVERSLKPNTQRSYFEAWHRALPHFRGETVMGLTPERVATYWGTVPRGSRTPHWCAISACLNWLSRHGFPGVEQCIPPKPKARRRTAYLTVTDYPHAFRAVAMARQRRWARVGVSDCILVGLMMPVRPGVLVSLRWHELDLGTGVAQLEDTKTGSRWLPIGKICASVLASQPRVGPYVWKPGRRDGSSHLSLSGLEHAWARCRDRYAEATGHRWTHPTVSPHGWRHSWGSLALGAGIPSDFVRRVLGHSSERMTEIYAHVMDTELRGAVDKLQAQMVARLGLQLSFATS